MEIEQRMSGCGWCVLRSAVCIFKWRKLVFSEHFPNGKVPVTFLGEAKERTEKEQTTTAPCAKRASNILNYKHVRAKSKIINQLVSHAKYKFIQMFNFS